MISLHRVTPAMPVFYTVLNLYARRQLSSMDGHLWRMERGLPPPLGSSMRRSWAPFITPPRQASEWSAVCGARPRSNRHLITGYIGYGEPWCQACRRLNPTPNSNDFYLARTQDPWQMIGYDARLTTPDPVSGV